jgi:hypothetical protein
MQEVRPVNKSPSFQFYPADWRKDPGVQALDYFDRGIWFEILCIMFESDERGRLILNGQRMPEEALARLLGLDNQTLTTTLTTLLQYGVAKKESDTGIIFNKRMVEDERLRQIRRECGSRGGNPSLLSKKSTSILVNQNSTTGVNQIPTPSSSSSSSKREKKEKTLDDKSSFCLPEDIDSEIWREFKEMRKKIKAPMTDRAQKEICKDLQGIHTETGQDKNEILKKSIKNSWRGVFKMKDQNSSGIKTKTFIDGSGKEYTIDEQGRDSRLGGLAL